MIRININKKIISQSVTLVDAVNERVVVLVLNKLIEDISKECFHGLAHSMLSQRPL